MPIRAAGVSSIPTTPEVASLLENYKVRALEDGVLNTAYPRLSLPRYAAAAVDVAGTWAAARALAATHTPGLQTACDNILAISPKGGRVTVPAGAWYLNDEITPPHDNDNPANGARVELYLEAGAVLYLVTSDGLDGRPAAEPNKAAVNCGGRNALDGRFSVGGVGAIDGTYALGANNIGLRVNAENTTAADITVRNFKTGPGIRFELLGGVEPICCKLTGLHVMYNKQGIVSNGVGVTGLVLERNRVERNDEEGGFFKDAGQMTVANNIFENNGNVDATKENLVLLGACRGVVTGNDFEDNPYQAHTSVRVSGKPDVGFPRVVVIGNTFVGYATDALLAPIVSCALDLGGSDETVVRAAVVMANTFIGHARAVWLGTNVQSYAIVQNDYSDNFDAGGSGQRVQWDSNWDGQVDDDNRFTDAAGTIYQGIMRVLGRFSAGPNPPPPRPLASPDTPAFDPVALRGGIAFTDKADPPVAADGVLGFYPFHWWGYAPSGGGPALMERGANGFRQFERWLNSNAPVAWTTSDGKQHFQSYRAFIVRPVYGPAVAVNLSLGNTFLVSPTDNVAYELSNPTGVDAGPGGSDDVDGTLAHEGQRVTVTVINATVGAVHAPTFAANWNALAPAAPAAGHHISAQFVYRGGKLEQETPWFDMTN